MDLSIKMATKIATQWIILVIVSICVVNLISVRTRVPLLRVHHPPVAATPINQ